MSLRSCLPLLLALTACEGAPEPAITYAEPEASPAGEALKADDARGADEACKPDRMIARVQGAFCPRVRGWSKRKLFSRDDNEEAVAVPGGLGDLCLYTMNRLPTRTEQRRLLRALPNAQADCQVVAPLQSAFDQIVGPAQRLAFARSVNGPLQIAGTPAATRIAVVDTSPRYYFQGQAKDGQSGHGLSMARVIRAMTCGPDSAIAGRCAGFVSHHLGLPRDFNGTVNRAQGGFFGRQSDPALAIVAAVRTWKSWQAAGNQPPQDNLVINLSLGWEGTYGGQLNWANPDPQAELGGGALAMYRAIEYATCHGALVVAAAGNDTGGMPLPVGPMYPAAWEQVAASKAECGRFGLPELEEEPTYRPLLYSVGAVDGRDRPVMSTRQGGRPRLATPGFQASTLYFDRSTMSMLPTETMTGSSVAAAVTSAAAALVWSYDPSLSPHEVMDRLYATAVPLETAATPAPPADYCQGSACDPIARLSVCDAIRATCPGGANCPSNVGAFLCSATIPAFSGRNMRLTRADAEAMQAAATERAEVEGAAATPRGKRASCGHAEVWSVGTESPEICADRRAHDGKASPWVAPQPGADPCPDCVTLSYNESSRRYLDLTLEISTAYNGYKLEDPTLYVDGKAYDLDKYRASFYGYTPTIMGGHSETIAGIDIGACGWSCPAPSEVQVTFQAYSTSGTAECAASSETVVIDSNAWSSWAYFSFP